MRLRTFGGLELEGADFGRPKPLLLLAYLALEGPQDRRSVAELFWPRARDHMNSLTVALARLRKGAPGAVRADRARVWTPLPSDVAAFLERLERGATAAALELYRGPFLDGAYDPHWGVELEEWVYATREYVAGHARRAWLRRAEEEAAETRYATAARHAERAFALRGSAPEPDELGRMHALLAAGDSLLAAAAQREGRELGLALRGDRELARDHLRSRLRPSASHPRHNLPAQPAGFVGRERDRAALAERLQRADGRLTSLVGPAGVGKTRLALQVARDLLAADAFPGGVHFVALESLTTPDAVQDAIADALGLQPPADGDRVEASIDALLGAPRLLVLDDFEHLLDAAPVVARLHEACPELALLVTSRERLHLHDERTYPVEGLPYPDDDAATGSDALRFDAVRMFVHRARMARPDLATDAPTLAAVTRICRAVEGLPLALELAATWLATMPPAEVADEIERGLDMLETRRADGPERHRSMRAAFEPSWALASERERRVLRRLSVFRGGFRREAASQVAGANLAVLASLADKSLLRVDASGRFDRHPLLYRFIREKLLAHPREAAATRERHAAHQLRSLAGWSERAVTGDQGEALTWIDDELENVRTAWSWAVAARRWDLLRPAIAPLAWYFKIRGRRRDGIDLLDEAVRAAEDRAGGRAVLAAVFPARARLLQDLGRYREARESALAGLRRMGGEADRPAMIQAFDTLGRVAWRSGKPSEAKAYWETALTEARKDGDPRALVGLLGDVAMIEQELGDHARSERLYREALAQSRAFGNRLHEIRNLNNLGELLFATGRGDAARSIWREGIALADEIGFRGIVPHLTVNLGMAAAEAGEDRAALVLFRRAVRQARDHGDLALEAVALAHLARLETRRGDLERAAKLFERSLRTGWSIKDRPAVLAALVSGAELRSRQGRPGDATTLAGLVLRDVATGPYDRMRVGDLLRILREHLSPADLAEAIDGGHAAVLADVVEATLRTEPVEA